MKLWLASQSSLFPDISHLTSLFPGNWLDFCLVALDIIASLWKFFLLKYHNNWNQDFFFFKLRVLAPVTTAPDILSWLWKAASGRANLGKCCMALHLSSLWMDCKEPLQWLTMIAHCNWFLQRVCNNKARSCALAIANVIFHLPSSVVPHMSWSPPSYITRLFGYLLSQAGVFSLIFLLILQY